MGYHFKIDGNILVFYSQAAVNTVNNKALPDKKDHRFYGLKPNAT